MSKTVQNVKNSLKFKAQVKANVISVRVGVKKYTVPLESRMLSGGEYLFLSFPACSEVFRVRGKELVGMAANEDAAEAFAALNPAKTRGRRKAAQAQLPEAVEAALREIPAGYRLGYDAAGRPRLVHTRKREPKD
jgi:hypothetical protein